MKVKEVLESLYNADDIGEYPAFAVLTLSERGIVRAYHGDTMTLTGLMASEAEAWRCLLALDSIEVLKRRVIPGPQGQAEAPVDD